MTDELYRGRQKPAKMGKVRTNATAARRFAVETCAIVRERDAFAHEVLESRFTHTKLSKEDKAFAQVLVLGVAATKGTLDEIIDLCLKSPTDVRDDLRDALRISVYELYFLKKEEHVAVDQGVELAKYVASNAGGLANAVLRKACALKPQFPFGDPKKDINALARLFGFPTWLATRLVKDLGAREAVELMNASNEQAPLFAAVNCAKSTDADVVKLFAECGVELVPQEVDGKPVAGCYFVDNPKMLLDGRISHALAKGSFIVSDLAAQTIAQLALPPQKPESFLEIGAGRGTKTILMQSGALRLYGSQMELTTLDDKPFKARLLRERAEKLGIEVKASESFDATTITRDDFPDGFDAIFIDSPCSGLGTLRRHPEIRWRLNEQGIENMALTGEGILKAAAALVRPGGRLTYSTCTVTKRENQEVIMNFLASDAGKDFEIVPIDGHASFSTAVTSGSCDAHFAVCMRRKEVSE